MTELVYRAFGAIPSPCLEPSLLHSSPEESPPLTSTWTTFSAAFPTSMVNTYSWLTISSQESNGQSSFDHSRSCDYLPGLSKLFVEGREAAHQGLNDGSGGSSAEAGRPASADVFVHDIDQGGSSHKLVATTYGNQAVYATAITRSGSR